MTTQDSCIPYPVYQWMESQAKLMNFYGHQRPQGVISRSACMWTSLKDLEVSIVQTATDKNQTVCIIKVG